MSADSRAGLLIVGMLGMTGSATVGGLKLMQEGLVAEEFGATSLSGIEFSGLPSATQLAVGGWDTSDFGFPVAAARHHSVSPLFSHATMSSVAAPMPGIVGPLDYPPEPGSSARYCSTLGEGSDLVAADIEAFRVAQQVENIVVIYLGSPSRVQSHADYETTLSSKIVAPASLMYAVGAVNAGAHFVDFTPSPALDFIHLPALFEQGRLRLAGRDGSTGQTFLKLTLAEAFRRRGIHISSWYSNNLIGNHDGLVLSDQDFSVLKLADKTSGLSKFAPDEHLVRIEYLPSWGDRKESWDAIELAGWLESSISLRINWRGVDSFLAAPLVLDLARLMIAAPAERVGLRTELGFFFKRPVGVEGLTQNDLWQNLVAAYAPGN